MQRVGVSAYGRVGEASWVVVSVSQAGQCAEWCGWDS
jgi:hypothetical protein